MIHWFEVKVKKNSMTPPNSFNVSTFARSQFSRTMQMSPTKICFYSLTLSVGTMGVNINFSRGVTSKFAYPFQVSDDAKKWTFTKRFTLSTPLVCAGLNLNFQYFVWNVFYTSAIRNAFSFRKLPNIHFFAHFLLISHNFRIINEQNNMSGEYCAVSVSYRQINYHCIN